MDTLDKNLESTGISDYTDDQELDEVSVEINAEVPELKAEDKKFKSGTKKKELPEGVSVSDRESIIKSNLELDDKLLYLLGHPVQHPERYELYNKIDFEDIDVRDDDLLEGLFYRNQVTVLAGDSYTGKSHVAVSLAWSLARGEPFCGQRVKEPLSVLYIAAEDFKGVDRMIKAQYCALNYAEEKKPNQILLYDNINFFDKKLGLQDHIDVLQRHNFSFDVIIIDHFVYASAGAEVNNSADILKFMRNVREFATEMGDAHVVLIAHTRKNKNGDMYDISGSSALVNLADNIMFCKKGIPPKELDALPRGTPFPHYLEVLKNKSHGNVKFKAEFSILPFSFNKMDSYGKPITSAYTVMRKIDDSDEGFAKTKGDEYDLATEVDNEIREMLGDEEYEKFCQPEYRDFRQPHQKEGFKQLEKQVGLAKPDGDDRPSLGRPDVFKNGGGESWREKHQNRQKNKNNGSEETRSYPRRDKIVETKITPLQKEIMDILADGAKYLSEFSPLFGNYQKQSVKNELTRLKKIGIIDSAEGKYFLQDFSA